MIRLRISSGQFGWIRATREKRTTLTTSTTSRKPVPQRGCSSEALRMLATSSGHSDSKALIVLCSAPWYWKTRRTSGRRPISAR